MLSLTFEPTPLKKKTTTLFSALGGDEEVMRGMLQTISTFCVIVLCVEALISMMAEILNL